MFLSRLLAIFLSGLFGISCIAQDTLATSPKKIKVLPLPAFGYSPETSTYIGAVALFTLDFYQDSLTRTSNAKLELNYTWNKQLIIESEWNYFFREENWFTKGKIHFSDYPDLFYGIGPYSQPTDELNFNSIRWQLNTEVWKKIGTKLYLGMGPRFAHYQITEGIHPDLFTSRYFGGLVRLVKDTRNNILTPTKGHYIAVMNNHNWSSAYYSQVELDLRNYFSLGERSSVFAIRFLQLSVLGQAPFYDLATIGGDKIIRGYRFGRFRTNHLSNLQVEYRSPLLWRISLAGFGGAALVYDNFQHLHEQNLKPNLGAGLRFLVDKKEGTNLRFDYAVGRHGESGFYISFGEAF